MEIQTGHAHVFVHLLVSFHVLKVSEWAVGWGRGLGGGRLVEGRGLRPLVTSSGSSARPSAGEAGRLLFRTWRLKTAHLKPPPTSGSAPCRHHQLFSVVSAATDGPGRPPRGRDLLRRGGRPMVVQGQSGGGGAGHRSGCQVSVASLEQMNCGCR